MFIITPFGGIGFPTQSQQVENKLTPDAPLVQPWSLKTLYHPIPLAEKPVDPTPSVAFGSGVRVAWDSCLVDFRLGSQLTR